MNKFFLILLVYCMGCLKQSEPIINSEELVYSFATDTYVKDLDLIGDTLYVANGTGGLKVFQIRIEDSFYLDSLYADTLRDIIKVYTAPESKTVFVLDRFLYTYVGSADFFDSPYGFERIACDEYQSSSAIIDDAESLRILTLYRHLSAETSINETNPYTTSVKDTDIDILNLDDGTLYFGNCYEDILDSLNYNLSDISYSNDRLYLANPDSSIHSIQVFKQDDLGDFNISFEDTTIASPKTIRGYESSYVVGFNDDAGCYIALLDTEGEVISKFTMFNGYTIRDIHYGQGLLLFSAGYDGVIVCIWDGKSRPIPYAMISSSYAYSALVYNENKIIVGTKNGIEIYEID